MLIVIALRVVGAQVEGVSTLSSFTRRGARIGRDPPVTVGILTNTVTIIIGEGGVEAEAGAEAGK